jgi:hypothetical protein
MAQENNLKNQESPRDKGVRELQDEALKTPGYSDDPHIESSYRSPNNEEANDKTDDEPVPNESYKEHGGGA